MGRGEGVGGMKGEREGGGERGRGGISVFSPVCTFQCLRVVGDLKK